MKTNSAFDNSFVLPVETRTIHANCVRNEKINIPGILYGKDINIKIHINSKILSKTINKYIYNTLFNVNINNKIYDVMFAQIQRHPVKDTILHFDLRVVDIHELIEVKIPVVTIGQSAPGAITSVIDYSIPVRCAPKDLIPQIECDITGIKDTSFINTQNIKLNGIHFKKHQNLVSIKIKK